MKYSIAGHQPKKFEAIASSPPCSIAIQTCGPNGIAAFHWELEFPEVFFGDAGYRSDRGFDAIIGNPPYDVLSEKETGRDLGPFKEFIDRMPIYEPSKVGKNNLYKLFICRTLALLADGGRLGFITPMAILGDEQASAIRAAIFQQGTFTFIEAFPQKDDPSRRVFRDAKLSTAVFIVMRTQDSAIMQASIISRTHPANLIQRDSPTLRLSAASIPLYDPKNVTIVSCTQIDWDLATRITASGQLRRLGEFVEFFQGEVNETIQRAKGNLVDLPVGGKLVTRGACVCLYAIRPASQGEDLYLDVDRFTRTAESGSGKRKAAPDAKALHFKHRRVVLQESSPQNNFRRVISAILQVGEFCNHTINYAPEHKSELPLEFVAALLNTKLIDWYFRLGSTNAHVSHYQLGNLPCPSFTKTPTQADDQMLANSLIVLRAGRWNDVLVALSPGLASRPHSYAVRDVVVEAVRRIMAIESARGDSRLACCDGLGRCGACGRKWSQWPADLHGIVM